MLPTLLSGCPLCTICPPLWMYAWCPLYHHIVYCTICPPGLCMELSIIYDLSIVLPGSFSRSSNPLANEEKIQGWSLYHIGQLDVRLCQCALQLGCNHPTSMVIEITLEEKSLNGPLYYGLCNLLSLEKLHMGFNDLYGILPPLLMNCSNLQSLNLTTNSLSGTLPDFSGLKSLKILDLTTNNFTGQFPTSLPAFFFFVMDSLDSLLFENVCCKFFPWKDIDINTLKYIYF